MCFKRLLFIGVFMIGGSQVVSAEEALKNDTGWYVGGLIGTASADVDQIDGGFSQSNNANGIGPYGGFNFNDWFGLESITVQTGNVADARPNVIDGEFFIFSVTPKFTWRINSRFSFYGKAGLALLRYEEELIDPIGGFFFGRRFEQSWSGIVPNLGIGAQLDITDSVKIRISHEYFEGRLDSNDRFRANNADVDVELGLTSIGVHYQF